MTSWASGSIQLLSALRGRESAAERLKTGLPESADGNEIPAGPAD